MLLLLYIFADFYCDSAQEVTMYVTMNVGEFSHSDVPR
jgi:hypothetical protein